MTHSTIHGNRAQVNETQKAKGDMKRNKARERVKERNVERDGESERVQMHIFSILPGLQGQAGAVHKHRYRSESPCAEEHVEDLALLRQK